MLVDAFWDSDPGVQRDHNEDAILGTSSDFTLAATRGLLFLVADGMGGHNAGEVASSQASEMVYSGYYASEEDAVEAVLIAAIRAANAELYQQAQADPARLGMGCTLTAAVVRGEELYAAHVGDSRLYLLRDGRLERLTTDHSWVEEQVRLGALTPEQARKHPQRNLITRAVGSSPEVEVDTLRLRLLAADALVLCSDGLSGEVTDEQIARVVAGAASAQEAVEQLIRLANDQGGGDNISAAVIRVEPAQSGAAGPGPDWPIIAPRRRALPPIVIVVALVAALILLSALLLLVINR